MIRALIVDDEPHAREELEALLTETGAIEVVGSSANALEGIKAINTLRPEVLFLDIHMPMINGFEMLAMVNQEVMPHVVFTTAYDEYSLKAFEEKTLDYLLKPVEPERLTKTIGKLQELLRSSSPAPAYKVDLIRRIPCLVGQRVRLICLRDVEYISSGVAGTQVHTADEHFYTEITLKALEERAGLHRCHKQYLVNVECIQEIVFLTNGSAEILTLSNHKIPVSRRYLKNLKQRLLL